MLVIPSIVFGQSATYTEIQNKSIATGSNGYAEYLPANYSTGTFPVVIFLHGVGERGNGANELYTVSNIGPLNHVKWSGWRPNVIMIAPQWLSGVWPSPDNVDQVITYVSNNYRVDKNRIYLTGLSMGGGAAWDYAASSLVRASKLAAMLPVCGYSGGWGNAAPIYTANLPVLATHNNGDPTVPYSMSVNWVNSINAGNPNPAAVLLTYMNNTHDAWDSTYNPNLKLRNAQYNWLDWMLQYSRGTTTTPPPSPAPAPAPTDTAAIMILPADTKYLTATRGAVNSTTAIYGTTKTISGTTLQTIYNTERYGSFSYAVPLAAGTYSVKFYFVELFHGSAGKRVFNVTMEGTSVLSNFDILANVPKFTALEKTFTANVTDGVLNLNFVPVVDNATISAIEIKKTTTSTTPVTYPTNIEIRDSATNSLLKTYSDVFNAPVKVVIKN